MRSECWGRVPNFGCENVGSGLKSVTPEGGLEAWGQTSTVCGMSVNVECACKKVSDG